MDINTRIAPVKSLLAICAVVLPIYIVLNTYHGDYAIALLEVVLFAVSLWLLLKLNKATEYSAYDTAITLYVTFCVAIISVIAMITWAISTKMIVLIIPIFAYLMLGKSKGFKVTAFFVSMIVLWHAYQLYPDFSGVKKTTFVDMTVFAIVTWVIAHYYEKNNMAATQKLTQKTAEAERANLEKNRFLATASHDLRQPAHALNILLAVLERTSLTPQQGRIVTQAKSANDNNTSMLTTLMEYSHLESADIVPEVDAVSLDSVLQQLSHEFAVSAAQKGLGLHALPTDAVVMTDATLLSLIVRNFVSNAIRYTEQGNITVAVCPDDMQHQIRFEPKQVLSEKNQSVDKQTHCWLAVWDTGLGIPQSEQDKVFQAFTQLDQVQKNQGLGLGLAIVAKLANVLGLSVKLSSQEGQGSCFAIRLPLSSVQPKTKVLQQHSVSVLLGLTVLVVENDELIQAAMVSLLTSFGCKVYTADSVSQAVTVCEQCRPSVVLTDYGLSSVSEAIKVSATGMTQGERKENNVQDKENGANVIQATAAIANWPMVHIVITGNTHLDIAELTAYQAKAVLHKPVNADELLETLTRVATDVLTEAA